MVGEGWQSNLPISLLHRLECQLEHVWAGGTSWNVILISGPASSSTLSVDLQHTTSLRRLFFPPWENLTVHFRKCIPPRPAAAGKNVAGTHALFNGC